MGYQLFRVILIFVEIARDFSDFRPWALLETKGRNQTELSQSSTRKGGEESETRSRMGSVVHNFFFFSVYFGIRRQRTLSDVRRILWLMLGKGVSCGILVCGIIACGLH